MKIRLDHVVKRFGTVPAVDGARLEIGDGELFTLLGPSGCGKTTLLRLIAGFYTPDGGEIWFGDRRVDGLRPYARNIGMVFQNYALWPHMTVRANIAYGLKLRKLDGATRDGRILQVSPPKDHYERPTGRFVADFVGTNNFLSGTCREVAAGRVAAETTIGTVRGSPAPGVGPGDRCVLAVRPENIALGAGHENPCEGRIVLAGYVGSTLRYDVAVRDGVVLKGA